LEDVLSFFITIGSPALAAYSLQITNLNTRWLSKAFLDVKFPNSKAIPTVISAFHHVPIQISSHPALLPSLIVLPQNDGYWNILLKGAKKIRRWSIPLIMNFVWVIIGALLTIVDSFDSSSPGDVGYGLVAIWIYLLPLIIGWLYVGSEPEPNHLRECLETANLTAWVATDQSPVLAESVVGHQALAIEFAMADDVPSTRQDELKASPIFNYSRVFVWSQNAERVLTSVKNAASNAKQKIVVGNLGGGRDSMWVKGEHGNVANENRDGRDDQVAQYCTVAFPALGPDIPGMASPRSSKTLSTAQLPQFHEPYLDARKPSRWATGIWGRVILATTFALVLQWGTASGAIIVHYWEYPIGFGCRTFAFLLYAVASTTSLFFFLASSILAHIPSPQPGQSHLQSRSLAFVNAGAILCRWLGKVVAIISAIGILTVCLFQVAGAFDTCYCTSTTFGGDGSVVFFTTDHLPGPGISQIWICGLAMAFSTALLFSFSIYLSAPPRR
jgi:hypothetical protein